MVRRLEEGHELFGRKVGVELDELAVVLLAVLVRVEGQRVQVAEPVEVVELQPLDDAVRRQLSHLVHEEPHRLRVVQLHQVQHLVLDGLVEGVLPYQVEDVLVAELQVQGDGPIELFLAGKGSRVMID